MRPTFPAPHPPSRPPSRLRGLALTLALLLTGLSASAAWAREAPSTDPNEPSAEPLAARGWRQASDTMQAPADAATLARWWQRWGVPGLDEAIQQTLARNNDLALARATLAQLRASRNATAASQGLQLGASASLSREHASQRNANVAKAGLDASWSPDLNGAQSAALAAADADAQAGAEDLLATQISLVSQAAQDYLQWRGARMRQQITEQSLTSLLQTQQLIAWRAQAGLASSADLQQARLSAEQATASLAALRTEVAQVEHALALLTGRAPGTPGLALDAASPLPALDALIEPLTIGLPADLLRRRPDLRAAEATLRAEVARLDKTRRAGWPTLSLTGSLGWQAGSLAALGNPGTGLATLAAGISGTLWDNGERDALVAGQQAVLDASRLRYRSAVLQAQKEVEDALVALRHEHQRSAALEAAQDAAGEVFLTSQQQQAVGLIDTRSLLAAQRDLLSAQLSLQSSLTSQACDLVQLYTALGGGWTADDAREAYGQPATAAAATPATP